MELTHSIADAKLVRHFRGFEFAGYAVLHIFEIAEQEHAFAFASSEVFIFLKAYVAGILAELLYGHT